MFSHCDWLECSKIIGSNHASKYNIKGSQLKDRFRKSFCSSILSFIYRPSLEKHSHQLIVDRWIDTRQIVYLYVHCHNHLIELFRERGCMKLHFDILSHPKPSTFLRFKIFRLISEWPARRKLAKNLSVQTSYFLQHFFSLKKRT